MRCAGDERRRDVERPNGLGERHGGKLDATGPNDRSFDGTSLLFFVITRMVANVVYRRPWRAET